MTPEQAKRAAVYRAAAVFRQGDSVLWDVLVAALTRLLLLGDKMP